MSATIVNALELNASRDVKYGKPKLNKSGGKAVPIQFTGDSKPLHLSTPMILTWGVKEYVDEKTGAVSYSMSLQFPGGDYETEEGNLFLQNMKDFEAKIKADAIVNCKEWLNKPKVSEEVIDALWTPMLKYPKDKVSGQPDPTRAPTLNIKVPFYDGKFNNLDIFDVESNLLFPSPTGATPMDIVTKGSNAATLIQSGGLWFANGKFGCTWRLFQAVSQQKASTRGRWLGAASSVSAPQEQQESSASTSASASASASSNSRPMEIADDSDNEGDDGPGSNQDVAQPFRSAAVVDSDEEEQTPTPTPSAEPQAKIIKKVVRKAKA
jgi:hypothetical protein